MTFLQRLALCWRILWAKPSRTLHHAQRGLRLAFPTSDDVFDQEFNDMVTQDVLEILITMGTQYHSGAGRYIVRDIVGKLCVHENLTPLQVTPDDWMVISDGGRSGEAVLQHLRCSHVFRQIKDGDVTTYDLDGKVFRQPSGATYTNHESRTPVVFPYTPTTVYVDVPDLVQDEERRA